MQDERRPRPRWKNDALVYQDEFGENQVHEELALSSSEEEEEVIVTRARQPVILDKAVVDPETALRLRIEKLEKKLVQVKAVEVVAKNEEDDKEKRYKVLPTAEEKEVDAEIDKIDELVGFKDDEDPEYYIDPEEIDGAGAISIDPGDVLKAEGEDREAWVKAIQEEITSIEDKGVKEDMNDTDVYEKYSSQGKWEPIRLPAKLVLTKKPLHDGHGGFKKKARICVCGNFEKGRGQDPFNRSEVPSSYELRTLLALCEEKGWDVGALDIKTAFLNADLDDNIDPIYLVRLPALLEKLGLKIPKKYWKLNKVLYGLRSGPKRWGDRRDKDLREASITLDSGETLTLEQGKVCKHLWLVKIGERIVARFLVYVDDVIITGPTEIVVKVMEMIEGIWECKLSGIISGSAATEHTDKVERVKKMNFLGMTLEKIEEKLFLHQYQYILTKLRDRKLLEGHGKWNLPVSREGKLDQEEKNDEFPRKKNRAQIEVGTLLWLTIKTRPDIGPVVGIAASCIAHNPSETLRLCQGIWMYLAMTPDLGMVIEKTNEKRLTRHEAGSVPQVLIASDASYAPGGGKSRTGVIIMVNDIVVHWTTKRQDRTALSTCEAEIFAHRTGVQLGLCLRDLVKEATGEMVDLKMEGDNAGAVRSVQTEITAWRTRHYAGDASWIRDQLEKEDIKLEHRPGKELIADGLTKILPRELLEQFRSRTALRSRKR